MHDYGLLVCHGGQKRTVYASLLLYRQSAARGTERLQIQPWPQTKVASWNLPFGPEPILGSRVDSLQGGFLSLRHLYRVNLSGQL